MLRLGQPERDELWCELIAALEQYGESVEQLPVSPELDQRKLRALLDPLDFREPLAPGAALRLAVEGLTRHQVHTPHPRYYGLFNPAPATMGIAADALVAAFNPQMAAWSHNPFAAEVERHLVRSFGERFGYPHEGSDGAFTSGGMEANHTALLTALTHAFPEFPQRGLRALGAQPVLYVSAEAHHSLLKAARLCGLGMDSVRHIEVDAELRMQPEALEQAIRRDRGSGLAPFLVAGTAGTTNAGAIDPLSPLADIAVHERLWFHADAAWGGAAALVPEMRSLLAGIEHADSITFDAHKFLSVPMGAGIYLTRHPDIMDRTFRVATAYMPREAAGLDIVDPHLHTMQWSRRFTGLKLFLSLLVAGWEGYAAVIRQQTYMGELLRSGLARAGWEIVNRTALPVVCFADPSLDSGQHGEIAMRVVRSGEAWISTTVVGGGRTVLRACITNYRTQPRDVEALVDTLERMRALAAKAGRS